MHEGKAPLALIELHRGHADIHHDGIDLRDANRGKFGAHRGKARRMEREAAVEAGDERLACSNRVGIAVEGVHAGASFQQRGGVPARAEGRIDNGHAGTRGQRGDHFVEQHGDVWSGLGHSAAPFLAVTISLAQAACAPFHSGPMPIS